MIATVLHVVAAPAPVPEKHPPVTPASAAAAPAAPPSFASLLRQSRSAAPEPDPARDAPPVAESPPALEPATTDTAAEPPGGAPPRPRGAVKGSTVKANAGLWIAPSASDRTTEVKGRVLSHDDDEVATGLPATAPWLPPAAAARVAAGAAAADGRARGDPAAAPAAALPAAASTELATTLRSDNTVAAAAAPADATAPAFTIGTAPASTAPAATSIEAATVAAPVGTPDFAEALAVQVSVLVSAGVQRAELHLNPADMGPVSVQIVVDGSQARVDFGADLAATRQAIEASLPELASALQAAGMTLHGGGVSQHASDRHEADTPAGRPPAAAHGAEGEPARPAAAPRRLAVAGGIDLYA